MFATGAFILLAVLIAVIWAGLHRLMPWKGVCCYTWYQRDGRFRWRFASRGGLYRRLVSYVCV